MNKCPSAAAMCQRQRQQVPDQLLPKLDDGSVTLSAIVGNKYNHTTVLELDSVAKVFVKSCSAPEDGHQEGALVSNGGDVAVAEFVHSCFRLFLGEISKKV